MRLTLKNERDEIVIEKTFVSDKTSYSYSGLPENSKFSWKITATNYGGTTESETAGFWTVDPNSIIENEAIPRITLFPSPTGGILNFEIRDNFEKISYIEIYDRLARLRKTRKLIGLNGTIDVSDLESGAYYLRAGADISPFTVIR